MAQDPHNVYSSETMEKRALVWECDVSDGAAGLYSTDARMAALRLSHNIALLKECGPRAFCDL